MYAISNQIWNVDDILSIKPNTAAEMTLVKTVVQRNEQLFLYYIVVIERALKKNHTRYSTCRAGQLGRGL